MKLQDLCSVLGAEVVSGTDKLQQEFIDIYACDLMSEVLVAGKAKGLLITTLVTSQVIRTAEMLDLAAILFVNGKIPNNSIISLAQEKFIPLLVSDYSFFETCGIIYKRLEMESKE
jgi:predicted transcriptional regulator